MNGAVSVKGQFTAFNRHGAAVNISFLVDVSLDKDTYHVCFSIMPEGEGSTPSLEIRKRCNTLEEVYDFLTDYEQYL